MYRKSPAATTAIRPKTTREGVVFNPLRQSRDVSEDDLPRFVLPLNEGPQDREEKSQAISV